MGEEQNFKTGDVVYLKSGGPAMTINGKDNFGKYICSWFKDEQVLSAHFLPSALTKERPTVIPAVG